MVQVVNPSIVLQIISSELLNRFLRNTLYYFRDNLILSLGTYQLLNFVMLLI
jgi:hypothetical protein